MIVFYYFNFFLFLTSIDKIKQKGKNILNTQLVEMGLRIRSRRKELRIRQAELAELIERGVGNPSIHVFIRICEELSVTPDYLLLGNMHTNNITQNILDNLSLCSSEDLNIINDIIKLYVQKNQKNWNAQHFS